MVTLTLEERLVLTHTIMELLDSWGMDAGDQVNVLGLPEGTRTRTLRRYREDTPLPDDPVVMDRAEHLLGIAEALRTTYPRNAKMGAHWMKRPHRRFQNRSPLATIVNGGRGGLVAVRAQLDCAYAWELTDARS